MSSGAGSKRLLPALDPHIADTLLRKGVLTEAELTAALDRQC